MHHFIGKVQPLKPSTLPTPFLFKFSTTFFSICKELVCHMKWIDKHGAVAQWCGGLAVVARPWRCTTPTTVPLHWSDEDWSFFYTTNFGYKMRKSKSTPTTNPNLRTNLHDCCEAPKHTNLLWFPLPSQISTQYPSLRSNPLLLTLENLILCLKYPYQFAL